jgi:murein DD-endopeptidase MepM/ murein hydrolase activator NlpD
MGKKHISFIIVPHTKTCSRTVSFSKRMVRAAQVAAAVLGVLGLVVTADYIRIRLARQDVRALRALNEQQKKEITAYQNSVGALENQLKVLGDKASKLNVMAGIKSAELLPSAGFVGGSYPGQSSLAAPPPVTPGELQNVQNRAADIGRNFDTLVHFFENKAVELAAMPSIWPVRGWPSSGFGWRPDPFTGIQTFHYGLDIVAAYGSPISATADGHVISVSFDRFLGHHVRILHGNGRTTIYGHLSKVLTRVGKKVVRGDVIGEVGSSGKSIGPHLHYEVRVNDKAVNPYQFILEE